MTGPRKLLGIVVSNGLLNRFKALRCVSPKKSNDFSRHGQLVIIKFLELRQAGKIHQWWFKVIYQFNLQTRRIRNGGCITYARLVQPALKFLGQRCNVQGFGQVIIHTRIHAAVAVFGGSSGSQANDGGRRGAKQRMDFLRGLQAIHARHVHIHQHSAKMQAGSMCLGNSFYGLLPIQCCL